MLWSAPKGHVFMIRVFSFPICLYTFLSPFPPFPTITGPYPLSGLSGCGHHDRVADSQGEEEVSNGGSGGMGRLGESGV